MTPQYLVRGNLSNDGGAGVVAERSRVANRSRLSIESSHLHFPQQRWLPATPRQKTTPRRDVNGIALVSQSIRVPPTRKGEAIQGAMEPKQEYLCKSPHGLRGRNW
jgi:hypothetical protein